jgi:O-antigen/teichoic acid export membrane protein
MWFGFFDIGFGNGLRNKFAEAKATGNLERARIYISTTYVVLILIFSAIWVLLFAVNFFIDWSHILNAPKEMARELSTLALVVFGIFCMQIVLKIINTVLTADQKPAKSALLDMLGQLMSLLIIVILIKTTQGSLLYLGLAMGIGPILVLITSSLFFYRKRYKPYAPSLSYVRFNYAKDMMPLGSKFFIIQISILVTFQTSNIIIAQVCGGESVAIYNIAFKYFSISYFLFGIVISPFWSAFTDAYTQNDYLWMKKVLKTLEVIAFFFVILIIILLIFSHFVYTLWIGRIFEIKPSISVLVAIYFIAQIYHGLYTPLLNGIGKIKLQFYVISFLAILIIPISLILGRKFGLEGIITATIIANLVIALYAPRQVHLLINKKAKGIWNK